jgi:outer membrane immunogenic protein
MGVAMRRLLLAAVMIGVVSGAQAADMPDYLRGSIPAGPAPRVYWQGYYVGGQGDYGSITSKLSPGINGDMQSTFLPPPTIAYNWQPLAQAHSLHGGYGAFAGYNSQWEDVVVGVEANYLHGGFRAFSKSTGYTYDVTNAVASTTNSSASLKLSDFGSARLRAGYAVGCFLPYMFVGGGFGSQTIERNVSASPAPVLPAWTADSKTKLVYGYSAGVGFDVMLVGGLFARAEYEYLRVTSDVESTVNSVRAGLGYKF